MKPTDLSFHITNFLTHYLAGQRNLSPNTIKAYRDVFTLLLRYSRDVLGIKLEKLHLSKINASFIEAFLDFLEKERHSSVRTQNHRLATLHAFFRYIQSEEPDHLLQCQKVLAIPLRRYPRTQVEYLSKEYLTCILSQPDLQAETGRRDAVLLSLLYDTGARVQELVDLSVGDLRLESPAQIRLFGKGSKMRVVPLMDATIMLLHNYLSENNLNGPNCFDCPLFQNRQGNRLTRSGVRYILQKYVQEVRNKHPEFTQTVSPHSFRHTKGMHLLQSGISLEIIRDFLGHVDIKTTQIYARANLEMKRKALEKISEPSMISNLPSWKKNKDLLDWLHSL
jgi:site-specific recombinase XerD